MPFLPILQCSNKRLNIAFRCRYYLYWMSEQTWYETFETAGKWQTVNLGRVPKRLVDLQATEELQGRNLFGNPANMNLKKLNDCLLYCLLMKLFLPECLSLQTASCHYDPRSKLSPHSVKQITLHTSPSFVQSIYKPWSMEYGMWRGMLLALNRMRLC